MATPSPPTATDPCTLLALAKAQMALLLSGQLPSVIETPQLGRVEFAKASVGDLQRQIDSLTAQCNQQTTGQATGRRKPFSLEAWP